ncbi:D-alanyl-D-alanine carboxypeptidase family protein [Sedimentibacter sp. MB31-C6]|uniref:D-alanyl-D-alanine carboxypeptidase family protein n=1 Tax=Sedimentibacter sp. MB31-C6 TaxID=3109366 RepID=UPI002DDD8275|nr:D-alanyl-D-alanine carboxypeptidase family protein [Sedimentibacter sp. MB36-C1]WSI05495.1 D-alanyl-D-alanine carboxypeptidase family protein [Sedimentibacter sp. MB36-C1]
MRRIRKILSLCLIVIMLSNTVIFGEINVNNNIKGALLGDLETGEILYEYNIDEQLAMASITKLMTYLLMMEAVEEEKISLNDDVVISGHAASTEGSSFGILSGETLSLDTLVKGMLIVSGNDCATAIAEHVGGTVDNFVNMMNEKASELGLLSASFINPHGLPINDAETGQNHMSISDIYKLVRHILTNYPKLLEITKQQELIIEERNYQKEATNPLLTVLEGVDGLKTGYTDKAGLCLVSTLPVTGNGQDYRLIAIIMGAQTHEERINKSTELLKYGMNNYSQQKLVDMSQPIDKVYISNSKKGKIDVFPATDLNKMVGNEDIVKIEVTYNDTVNAPLIKGDKIGTISVYINEEETKQIDAVVGEDVKKANIFIRIYRFLLNIFGN